MNTPPVSSSRPSRLRGNPPPPYRVYYQSPIGTLEILGSAAAITAINFLDSAPATPAQDELPAHLQTACRQLAEYFQGQRQTFDLPLEPAGTPFQQRVWQELLTVPYGRLLSYQDVANAIGNPHAVRAVGAANGQNPIPIVIPCHRILASDGKLTGYGGGLWRKEWLLRHEGSLLL